MNPLPSNWVDEIFRRFHGRFGNRFLAEFTTGQIGKTGHDEGLENAKLVWAEELAGFAPDEIKRGLSAQYEYLPDCDKFKLACRPAIALEQAFYEAVEQMRLRSDNKDEWSSAAIYWAAVELGNDLHNFPYHAIQWRWKTAYEAAKKKIENCSLPNQVPQRLVALPSPGKSTISNEESEKRWAKVYEILNKKVVRI